MSDRASDAARWQEHFTTLLNRSTQSPSYAMVSEAQTSTPDSTIDTFPPTITEVYKVTNKIKAGKAPGVCGIYPEWCLRRILRIPYTTHVTNKEVRRRTGQSPVTSTIVSRLYDNSVSCVRTGGTHSSRFKIEAGVRQGCVLAPDSFATGMDWLLDRTVESCSIGVAFGQSSSLIWILLMMSLSLLNC